MVSDNQVQKAGDGATQVQANSITIINGITEERVRTIFNEQYKLARKEYTEDAYRIADERIGTFESRLMPRIMQVEDAMPSFSDPAFQVLLRHAQVSAATTDREADYDLLTELLVCHVQKGNDRKNRAGINRAVEIVGEIDNDALCGLTVAHAIAAFSPASGNCSKGLSVLNDLFSKLMYQTLPQKNEWLDHLDILGAIRLSSLGTLKKTSEYYGSVLNGYVCTGIKDGSEEFHLAKQKLRQAKLDDSFLVPNECLPGYKRLNIRSDIAIPNVTINYGPLHVPIKENQISAIKEVWNMYSQDSNLKHQAGENFMKIWDGYEYLHALKLWWDDIPQSFDITQVGRILAQTNAKRCDPSLPDLI